MTKLVRRSVIEENHKEELEKLRLDIDSETETLSITLKVPAEKSADYSDYNLAKLAFRSPCVDSIEFSKEDIVSLEDMTKLEKALLLVKYAEGINHQAEARKIVGGVVADKWQVSFFAEDLEQLKEKTDEKTIATVSWAIAKREEQVKAYHATFYTAEKVENYIAIYNEIVDGLDKFIVLNAGMGQSKTETCRMIYDHAREQGLFPIMITGKRTIASNFYSADHADHYKTTSEEESKGLIGVVNSIVMSKHEEARKAAKVVIIDEPEDLFDHMSSDAFGRTYKERVSRADTFFELLKQADKVIVADATITDKTIEKLYSVIGSQARIITAGQPQSNSIYLKTESEVVAKMVDDTKAGKKVAGFCDYNVEDFSAIVESLKAATNKNVIGINAAYLEETKQSLEDLPKILDEADVALISPVINAGASIVDDRFDSVHVMSGYTLNPISLIQSMRRFRCADKVYLSFKRGTPSNRLTDPRSIIHDSIVKTSDFPFADAQAIYETESGRFLADHAAYKNAQFKGFKQTVLIAAQQLGFEVVRKDVDLDQVKQGREAKKAGRVSNREISRNAAQEASDLRQAGRVADVDMGKKDAQTYAQQQAERAVGALDILKLPAISDESYVEIFDLDIDKIVLNRKILAKRISGSSEVSRMDVAADVAGQFLAEAGVDFDKLTESEITKEKADQAFENLLNPIALENGNATTGMAIIRLVFPSANFNKVNKVQVVKDCLKAIGHNLINISKNNSERVYSVGALTRKTRKDKETIEHNLSQIADKYFAVEINQGVVEEVEADDILITDIEKRARKSIDAKKANEERRLLEAQLKTERKLIEEREAEFAAIIHA